MLSVLQLAFLFSVVGSGGGSETGSSVFLWRMELLDGCYLLILRSASGGFNACTQPLSLLQKSVES